MSYRDDLHAEVQERIASNLASHEIAVLRADGLYRHWRCRRPGTYTYGFDIITWPGHLCYTGDVGTFVFSRAMDMLEFMRTACQSYSYAAEKCVAHGDPIREWRREVFEEELQDVLAEHPEHSKRVADIREEFLVYESPADASRAMYESRIWDDLPTCEYFSYRFLWCLAAIKWFTDRTPVAAGGEA